MATNECVWNELSNHKIEWNADRADLVDTLIRTADGRNTARKIVAEAAKIINDGFVDMPTYYRDMARRA